MTRLDTTPTDDGRLFTGPFVRVMLSHVAFGLGISLSLHLSGLLQVLGAGEAEIGRIVALTPLVALVLTPMTGRLMDVRGRPLVVRLGGLLLCASAWGYASLSALGPWVYALRALEGVGSTMVYVALFAHAADLVPERHRTHGLALFGGAGMASLSLCGPLGDALIAAGGYRALFSAAFASLALAVLLAFTLRDARPALSASREAPGELYSVAAQGNLLPIWAAAFPFFLTMSGLMTFMKTYVLTLPNGSMGAFFTTYAVVALSLRLLLGSLPDRVGTARMVLPALSAYAAGACTLAFTSGTLGLFVGGALSGIGHGYGFPVLFSLTVTRAHPRARGSATALFTTIDWAGHVAAPPLLGLVIEHAGYTAAFATLALALGAGLAAFHLLDARPT